jgi:hypothetical protein
MSKNKEIKDIDVYLITRKNTHLFRNPEVYLSMHGNCMETKQEYVGAY